MVGLIFEDQPVAGVIYIPGLDELIHAAIGQGAYHEVAGRPLRRAQVARSRTLQEVFLSLHKLIRSTNAVQARHLLPYRQSVCHANLGDAYGYLLSQQAVAEVMVDPKVSPWDVAAVLPVIEEAGGRFTDWKGNRTIHGGDGVATNGALHSEVLELLK